MNWLTRFGITQSRFTVLVMIGLIMQGLILYSSFPKREDPEITIRAAVVVATYSGMAPERMEQLIAVPIERKVREIGAVKDINTLVTTGRADITISLKESLSKADLQTVFQDLRNKMKEVSLPQGTDPLFINTNYGDVSIATIALTGEGFSYAEMKVMADELRRRLYLIKGLAKIDILGAQEERIWLEIDNRKLASVGVQLNQLIADLQKQNVILPAGELDAAGVKLLLETSGDLKSVDAIRNVLTKVKGLDGFARLQDLVKVRRGYTEPLTDPAFFNGKPALMVSVQMQGGQDIEALGVKLKAAVKQFEQEQPIGVSLDFATFQADKVSQSVKSALSNVGQTFIVVLVIVLLFLGVKSGFIIASIVPFTVMFALIGMSALGIELEQVSIAAVIISLGLLVDNGLVIVEDIQEQVERGIAPREAALKSGSQFIIPLMVASVTTISAFMPMMTLEGTAGEYAFSLGMVVTLMLGGSWFTAMFILPALCTWFMKQSKKGKAKVEAGAERHVFIEAYGGLVRKLLKVSPLVVLVIYGLSFGSVMLFAGLKSEQFPLSERNQYLIYMDMPKGTALSETQKQALRVSKWLGDATANPENLNHALYVGSGGPRFYLALSPADSGESSAFFLINTKDFKGAVTAAERARFYLAEKHPEARFKVKRLSMGGGESGIVELNLAGPDLNRLMGLAKQIETIYQDAPFLIQNENDWGNKVFKVTLDVEQDKARDLGLTSERLAQLLNAYFSGSQVSVYREGDKAIPIVMRAAEPFRNSLEDLRDMTIGVNGALIALEQVAKLGSVDEFSSIRRENQVRSIKVSIKSGAMSAGELLAYGKDKLDKLDLSGGYSLTVGGETKDAAETNEKLAAGLPLTFIIMVLALIFQFNSFRRSALTLLSIPLIIVGVPIGLHIMGMPISFFGTLGMISLAGIIINNAIVLIDQIDIDRASMELDEAIVSAAQKRFRPIMLTSITTVIGLLPMAISGGALWEPMAVVMMGGLIVASVLSLFFVPAGYHLLFRWKA